ncbi:glycosyltransferase family 2 protein [Desulfoferula mesophila]|uniref:Glycosyltransferase 2-like domain-containing protein n=1 Tax=Desulfoferula mesophila TaxID=3058419 RepID=A0AAU9EXH3_9BACT|nr:hypothetical protein FAK_32910 [Desulfoferula mesophilus]
MPAEPSLSVVSPFFNNEAVLARVIRQMADTLDQQFGDDWEFILVNDGSVDGSLQIARETISKLGCPRIRLMSLPWNHGRGRAIKTGIDAARGKIIVTTEADGSWGRDIVRELYDAICADPALHCVVASVHLPGGGLVNVPRHRVLLTIVGNWIIRKVFLPEISMNTGMTRAYRREVIQPLVTNENGKEFHLEVLLKLSALGFRISEIPATITWAPSPAKAPGRTRHKSSTKIMKTINTHLRFVAIANPIRNFAWMALCCFLASIFFLGWAVINLIIGDVAIYLGLVALFLMLFALVLMGFSICFCQFKEILSSSWMAAYRQGRPPSSAPAKEIFFNRED